MIYESGSSFAAIDSNAPIRDPRDFVAQELTVPSLLTAEEGQAGAEVLPKKPKKTKEQRRCPRKRRAKKREGTDVPSSSLHRRDQADYGGYYSGEDDEQEASVRRTFSSEGRNTVASGDSLFDPVLSSWFKEMKAKRLEGRVSSASAPGRGPIFDPSPPQSSQASSLLDPSGYSGISQSDSPFFFGLEDETRFFFEIQKERSHHPKPPQQQAMGQEDDDYMAEQAERMRWRAWALHAAEMERRRRMRILEEIDLEQERERQARRQWAIEAIEKEKNDRISAQFLSNLTSTNWFNDAITAYHEDYELVCPYYKLGCKVYCRRSTVQQHLKKCRFAIEYTTTSQPASDENSYEVVCPNSILGCTYTGCLKDLTKHLTECTFLGRTVQQEREERQQMMKHVIMECEEERARRVQSDEYVVTIRKSENRIPSRSGYRADSGEDDGSTAAIIRELVPISPEHASKASLNAGNQAEPRVTYSNRQRKNEEGAKSPPLNRITALPPATPIYEPVKTPETAAPSNPPINTQSEIDSSDFSDSGSQTRSGNKKKPSLQRLLEEQKRTIIAALHREASQLWLKVQSFRRAREDENKTTISYLNTVVKEMWPFADVRPFGSFASGLYSLSSDMDLVVCFADQYKSLPTVTGVAPLLQNLAEWLLMKANDAVVIRKVLLHSAVPIIKADVKRSVLKKWCSASGSKEPNDTGAAYGKKDKIPPSSNTNIGADGNDEYLSIDISIDAPSHSGVATTAFVKQMLAAYPVIGPAVCLLKTFLKSKGLGDPYSGGLSPYGLFLLVLLLKQQRETIHASLRPAVDSASPLRSPVRMPSLLKDAESRGPAPAVLSAEIDFKKTGAVTVADLSLSPHRSLPDAEDLDLSILRIRTRSRSDVDAPKFLFPSSLSQDSTPGLSPTAGAIGVSNSPAPPNNNGIVFSPRRQQSNLTRGNSSDNIIGMKQGSERPPATGRAGARSFMKSTKRRPSFLLTWNCLEQQIDFGRRVAEKLLEGRSGSMRIRGFSISSEVDSGAKPAVSGDAQTESVESEAMLDLSEGELGSLLIEFLEYFGEGWDDEKIGFSVRDGGFKFDLSSSAGMPSHPQADDPFVIEDPVNVINNVARTCYNVNYVMRSIQEAHTRYRASVVRLGTRHKTQSGGKKKKLEEDVDSISGGGNVPVLKEVVLETIPEVAVETVTSASSEQLGIIDETTPKPAVMQKKGNVIRAARRIELAVASHSSVDNSHLDSSTATGTEAVGSGAGTLSSGAKASSAVAKKMDPIESVIREIFELDIGAF